MKQTVKLTYPPITKLKTGTPVILLDDLQKWLNPKEFNRFVYWIAGQTMPLVGRKPAVLQDDFRRFISGQSITD